MGCNFEETVFRGLPYVGEPVYGHPDCEEIVR
jgi:hypothetical protein